MQGTSPSQDQGNLFAPLLKDFINMDHPLVALAERIDWVALERDFARYYSHTGKPSKPVRMMAGLLILKQLYNLGDETLMPQWVSNPYYQYFCGEASFQHRPPCDPSDLVHFRKRIGRTGVKEILKLSVELHAQKINRRQEILVDTTVQEKNITFPTDAKLHRRIIEKCNDIARAVGVKLRQSYSRTVKQLFQAQHFAHHPKRAKKAKAARRKLKTLAGRQLRDLERKLPAAELEAHQKLLDLFQRVLDQQRSDKNKIYSLHELEVACISKGKAHKKYEFGSKVSVAMVPELNIIVGVETFTGNPNDSTTLAKTLESVKELTDKEFKRVIVDRGYRGAKSGMDTEVLIPSTGKGKSPGTRQKERKKFRRRAAIEPIIGHLKHDFRMLRSYLKGHLGDEINAMMAAAALNMKKWMRNWAESRSKNAGKTFLAFWLQVQIVLRAFAKRELSCL